MALMSRLWRLFFKRGKHFFHLSILHAFVTFTGRHFNQPALCSVCPLCQCRVTQMSLLWRLIIEAVTRYIYITLTHPRLLHTLRFPLSLLIDVKALRCVGALRDAPMLGCIRPLCKERPASPTSCTIRPEYIDYVAHGGRIKALV